MKRSETPTQRALAKTLTEMTLTIGGLITMAEMSHNVELLKQVRDWAQQTERRVETAISTVD